MNYRIFLFVYFISLSCFSQNIVREAIKNSNLQEIAYQLNLEPGSEQTIETTFTIEKDGMLSNMQAFSNYPELNEEALRILKTVGKLQPREVRGKMVTQDISLPIVFKVESKQSRIYRLRKEARSKKNEN
ncbi:MAG: energy transducer TonB [Flavobacteriaceae bacterium]